MLGDEGRQDQDTRATDKDGPTVNADPGLERLRRPGAELRDSMAAALEQALAAPAPGRAAAWIERVHVSLVELSADVREHVAITEGPERLHCATYWPPAPGWPTPSGNSAATTR